MSIGGKVKMSVTIKTIGKERIHVKETTTNQWWVIPFCVEMFIIGAVGFSTWAIGANTKYMYLDNVTSTLCGVAGFVVIILSLSIYAGVFCEHLTSNPAYYVDTSMYGVGGKIIVKTNPTDDRIAICKEAHGFELEMRKRMENEDKLKILVAECK